MRSHVTKLLNSNHPPSFLGLLWEAPTVWKQVKARSRSHDLLSASKHPPHLPALHRSPQIRRSARRWTPRRRNSRPKLPSSGRSPRRCAEVPWCAQREAAKRTPFAEGVPAQGGKIRSITVRSIRLVLLLWNRYTKMHHFFGDWSFQPLGSWEVDGENA